MKQGQICRRILKLHAIKKKKKDFKNMLITQSFELPHENK